MRKPKYNWPAELTQEELSFLERAYAAKEAWQQMQPEARRIVSNAYHRAMRKLRLPNAKVIRSRGQKRGPRSRANAEAAVSP